VFSGKHVILSWKVHIVTEFRICQNKICQWAHPCGHLITEVVLQGAGALIDAFECIQKVCVESVKYLPVGACDDEIITHLGGCELQLGLL